ncbi:MAG: glycerate kinase [Smithellaceae bacterium]|nr:glycerate kinase [Smithellaceae bacterium]
MFQRESVKEIFTYALQTVLPDNLIRDKVRIDGQWLIIEDKRYQLGACEKIHVLGSGKASIEMAKSMEKVLGERLAGGLVVANYDEEFSESIRSYAGSHPILTEKSVLAAEMLSDELSRLSEDDFFIYLLSGGNSALVEKPVPPVTLEEMQEMIRLLLANGVPIEEMNIVRKHLSTVKGGRLGRLTKARGVVLVLSDVIGEDLEAIGSAPLYQDSSSYQDVLAILNRYNIRDAVPASIAGVIGRGLTGEIEETPKTPNDRIDHIIIGSNMKFLLKARQKAQSLGMTAHIMTSTLRGEAREVAKAIVSLGEEIIKSGNPYPAPVCLLFGGETTVTVKGKGRGGRNQEMCLAALRELRDNPRYIFLSAGSDGIDGASEAAGAIVDHTSYKKAQELSLKYDEYLGNNNSNQFLEKTGDLIITGPTGTNVIDMTILVVQ